MLFLFLLLLLVPLCPSPPSPSPSPFPFTFPPSPPPPPSPLPLSFFFFFFFFRVSSHRTSVCACSLPARRKLEPSFFTLRINMLGACLAQARFLPTGTRGCCRSRVRLGSTTSSTWTTTRPAMPHPTLKVVVPFFCAVDGVIHRWLNVPEYNPPLFPPPPNTHLTHSLEHTHTHTNGHIHALLAHSNTHSLNHALAHARTHARTHARRRSWGARRYVGPGMDRRRHPRNGDRRFPGLCGGPPDPPPPCDQHRLRSRRCRYAHFAVSCVLCLCGEKSGVAEERMVWGDCRR